MYHPPKRDFGTLRTEQIAYAHLADFESAPGGGEKAEALAGIIYEAFADYYTRSRKIPVLVKEAFETRDWPKSVALSQERIAIFSVAIFKTASVLKQAILENDREGFWEKVEACFSARAAQRYEKDLALAYLASVRRIVYQNKWVPIAYERNESHAPREDLLHHFDAPGRMTPELVERILAVPGIEAPFRDLAGDAKLVAERINGELEISESKPLEHVDILDAGFYRNRGAYILGSTTVAGVKSPLALALLHKENGVEVDGVILRETTLRHVFSSTLANLHVTMNEYHELVDFLHSLMPARPRAMHYSTIGYNHVGKLAVMEQITSGLKQSEEQLDYAPGPRGSVAIAFTAPCTQFVLKVIRDTPTDQYKWDKFGGKDSVLAKYRTVHELNRSGSMLDNIIYWNIVLPREMFAEEMLEELLVAADSTVSLYRDGVFFSHIIVQRKMVPVPLYLQSCTRKEAEMVVIRLGQCIRNNAAANVFNKDLDGRNYGVSSLRFVYLFDYDAVESLTDIKVRTNVGREDGEEDIPDWFFEEGDIFLPEELEMHLRLPDRGLKRLFREAHGELLTEEYWVRMQKMLHEGRVPRVRTYPRSCQLTLDGAEGNLTFSAESDAES